MLTTLAIIISFAENTRKIGDPYGPITMRMIASARREIEIYDRNRESLFHLRDAELRAKIQTLVIRLTMPLDALIEAAPEKSGFQSQLRLVRDEDERKHLEDSVSNIARRRRRPSGSFSTRRRN